MLMEGLVKFFSSLKILLEFQGEKAEISQAIEENGD